MAIDIKKLRGSGSREAVTHPRDIFRTLRKKDAKKYEFPRDVQTQVWTHWHQQRTERDQILKVNTGGGKTVIGLLILQSCLNESKGPAVFVSPNIQLSNQVAQEAEALGLRYTTDPHDSEFSRGRAILIVNIYKLFNGRSVFGVGRQRIPVKSIVFDDAHACIQTIEEQFTLKVPVDSDSYSELKTCLLPSIKEQSESKAFEIEGGYPQAVAEVPFWAWRDHMDAIRKSLYSLRDHEKIQFVWPMIKDDLENCRCVFGREGVEVSPRVLPTEIIPSFQQAERRVFMSATFADDNALVTQLDVCPSALERLVVPEAANDVGDRMILVPQAITPKIEDAELREYLADQAEDHNVVVIVPSDRRAREFWGDHADAILDRDSFASGVADLRSDHVGLVVFVNRYDGIDLPDDACRILVLDGLPDVRRIVDRVDEASLFASTIPRVDAAHRVEQGMGRATRSAEDYAVVMLMGSDLVQQLYRANLSERFTVVTAAQMQLSEELSEQMTGGGITMVDEAVQICLDREADWVDASRGQLVGLKYPGGSPADSVAIARRKGFNELRSIPSKQVADDLTSAVEVVVDKVNKGYLLAEAAAVLDRFDRPASQILLTRARKLNRGVLLPMCGIEYVKLKQPTQEQASRCHAYLASQYKDQNDFVVEMSALLGRLVFERDNADAFEYAFYRLGLNLGFPSQRPEKDYGGNAPDVLWALGDLNYAIIEAKNGAEATTISQSYCNQLDGFKRWFYSQYDHSCTAIPVFIHPSRRTDASATPPEGGRVITVEKLEALCKGVREFTTSVAALTSFGNPAEIAKQLNLRHLTGSSIFNHYSSELR